MSNVKVVAYTQKIIVDPANSSVSVINAGPIGPGGPVGPSEAAAVLTTDGDILTRAAGVLARITRPNLAADTAFTSKFKSTINHGATAGTARTGTAPVLWIGSVNPTNAVNDDELYRTDTTAKYVRVAGAWVEVGSSRYMSVVNHGGTAGTARSGVAPIFWIGSVNPTNATDNDELYRTDTTAYYVRVAGGWIEIGSSRYVTGTKGAGAPGGTGTAGDWYYDTTAKRAYRSDGAGWIIMSEPVITSFVPTVSAVTGTITTVGTKTFAYQRSNGWLDWEAYIGITTNGTGAGAVLITLPIAYVTLGQSILGFGREILVTGKMLNVQGGGASTTSASICQYDNIYPASNGSALVVAGHYRMNTPYL